MTYFDPSHKLYVARRILHALQLILFCSYITFTFVLAFTFTEYPWMSLHSEQVTLFRMKLTHYQMFDMTTGKLGEYTSFSNSNFPTPMISGVGITLQALLGLLALFPLCGTFFIMLKQPSPTESVGLFYISSFVFGTLYSTLSLAARLLLSSLYSACRAQVLQEFQMTSLETRHERQEYILHYITYLIFAWYGVHCVALCDWLFHTYDFLWLRYFFLYFGNILKMTVVKLVVCLTTPFYCIFHCCDVFYTR